MIYIIKVSHSCPMSQITSLPFGLVMSCLMPYCFTALFTGFHTIFHTHFVPWLFTKSLCPVGQSPSVTADISSQRALLLAPDPPSTPVLIKQYYQLLPLSTYTDWLASVGSIITDSQVEQSCPLIVYRLLFRTLCYTYSIRSLIITRLINA